MDPDLAFAVWSGERARRVESVLERLLPAGAGPAEMLHDAMHYAVLGGGKRIRALLAYAGGELASADPDVVDCAAAAVELDPIPGKPGVRALRVFERGIEEGMLYRFTGDTIAVAPPYIATKAEVEAMVDKLRVAIRAAA